MPAAINLLERATALLPDDDSAMGLLMPELGSALTEAGRLADAESLLDSAVEIAARRDDALAQAHATVAQLGLRLQVDTEAGTHQLRERFEPLVETLEQARDDLGLGRLWRLRGLVHWIEARSADADAAWERAADHFRRAGDQRGWSDVLSWLASSAYVGPMPVERAIARCESIRAQLADHPRAQALVARPACRAAGDARGDRGCAAAPLREQRDDGGPRGDDALRRLPSRGVRRAARGRRRPCGGDPAEPATSG